MIRVDGVVRISVGYNPWSKRERTHDISAICERYGGGGHPFVGGIALPSDDAARVEHVARSIRTELAS
jgi:nanoRNase/pAp phosphatase (c-di-AMP/oligoRNAs hydrolase)